MLYNCVVDVGFILVVYNFMYLKVYIGKTTSGYGCMSDYV